MAANTLWDASLRPPALDHQPPDEAGAAGSWAMLDVRAYIANRRNATTARTRMSNGVEIQVTFCVVLNVGFGSLWDCNDAQYQDIFVYHAGGREKGPSLRLVTNYDNPYCLCFNTGILRHREDTNNPDDDHYHIVAMEYSKVRWQFHLHLFDSETGTWSSRLVRVQGREHQHSQFRHAPKRVLMLGRGGFMAFVDPWRGILVCDVLDCEAQLHYIPFPRPLKDNKKRLEDPAIARDIAVVQGRIKVVDCFYCSASGAWKASVWSRAATSLEKTNWDRDYVFEIRTKMTAHLR